MLQKNFLPLFSAILVFSVLFLLQNSQVKADEIIELPENITVMGPLEDCKERMTGERAILHCLEKHLEEAEQTHEGAAHRTQQKAHMIENPHNKKSSVKSFAASALAFENYREAECRRQQSLVAIDMEGHFIYLACKTDLFHKRVHELEFAVK